MAGFSAKRCAKKLFTTLSNGMVTYDHVDDFQQLMNKVMV